jgi:hypothetical protein
VHRTSLQPARLKRLDSCKYELRTRCYVRPFSQIFHAGRRDAISAAHEAY